MLVELMELVGATSQEFCLVSDLRAGAPDGTFEARRREQFWPCNEFIIDVRTKGGTSLLADD